LQTQDSKGYAACMLPRVHKTQAVTQVAALALAVTIVFAGVFWQRIALNARSDLHIHIDYAKQISALQDITSPHFLFQLIIKAVHTASGMSYELAAALSLGGCYGLMAVLIVSEIRRRAPYIETASAFCASIAILVASHIFILTAHVPNLYYGYLVPTTYHNPTQQLNKLFTLAIWFMYCSLFVSGQDQSYRTPRLFALGALCVASAIAKPSFLIAFLPVSGVMAGFDFLRGRWKRVSEFVLAIMLPSAVIMIWQFWLTYGKGAKSGVVFAPFAIFPDPTQYLTTLPLALLFPLLAAALLHRAAKRTPEFVMAWAILVIGLLYTLLLAESGPRQMQGNFAWTAQTGAFLVYVEALLLLLKANPSKVTSRVLIATLTLHVACGVVYAIVNATIPAVQWL